MIFCMLKKWKALFETLEWLGYQLKVVGEPKNHLVGDCKHLKFRIILTSRTVILVGRMVPGDHPELDKIPLFEAHATALYMSMSGAMQWAVALGGWISFQLQLPCLDSELHLVRDIQQDWREFVHVWGVLPRNLSSLDKKCRIIRSQGRRFELGLCLSCRRNAKR